MLVMASNHTIIHSSRYHGRSLHQRWTGPGHFGKLIGLQACEAEQSICTVQYPRQDGPCKMRRQSLLQVSHGSRVPIMRSLHIQGLTNSVSITTTVGDLLFKPAYVKKKRSDTR